MATLRYRRDRKRWEVDYRRHGARFKRLFKSKQNATEYRRKAEGLIEREHAGLNIVEPITFKAFGEIFIENHLANKSSHYRRVSTTHIRNMFNKYFGSKDMSEISHGDIASLVARRENQGVAPKTIQNDLQLLHVIFRAAIKNGFAAENPVKDIEAPRAIPRKVRMAVADCDLTKALRVMQPEELFIVLLLRNTGMRLGELYQLRYDDINFQSQIIGIRSVEGATTKNYRSRETILTPTSAKILAILDNHTPLLPLRAPTFQDRLLRLKQKYGWTWDAHCLRHTFITRLRYANIPERIVAHYAGHNQQSITDRYTSYLPEYIQASINAIDFGMEFLNEPAGIIPLLPKKQKPDVVVPKWSPQIGSVMEPIEITNTSSDKLVGCAGIEPATR